MTGLGIGSFVVGFALNAGPLGDFPMVANPFGIDTSCLLQRRNSDTSTTATPYRGRETEEQKPS
jgi:hypothetical protein